MGIFQDILQPSNYFGFWFRLFFSNHFTRNNLTIECFTFYATPSKATHKDTNIYHKHTPNCIFLVAELIFLNWIFLNMWHLIEILLFSSSLTKKMPTCVNFLKNVKGITASLNVCPSPLKALLSGLFCLQLFSGTPLNRTGPPNHFLLNYLSLSPYLTSISFCFLDKCI